MPDQEQEIVELSTGVKLKLHRPSPMLMQQATKSLIAEEPKPPKVWIQEKEREEENPNDPDYKAAHAIWISEMGVRSLRALIPTGTSLHFKPDDVVGPEDEDFSDLMEAMGQEAANGKYSRYVQWVLSVACDAADLQNLSVRLLRLVGVREEDVAEVLDMFPSLQERLSNHAGTPDGSGEHGDPVSQPPTGAGVGD